MSTSPMIEATNEIAQTSNSASLLVCLPFATADELHTIQAMLAAALSGQQMLLAAPGLETSPEQSAEFAILDYPTTAQRDGTWALTAVDYLSASQLAVEHNADVTLILGAEADSLSPTAFSALVIAVVNGKADLAIPHYTTGPHDALVSSALLYPMTNALFGVTAHMPLPPDIAFSSKMAHRLTTVARKPATGLANPLLWPASEATLASLIVREVEVGNRTLPQPVNADLNTLLAEVVGSLFSDTELKATFWQRARPAMPVQPRTQPAPSISPIEELEEVRAMVESFRIAYDNLQEIWSLVLPPQSLLRVKRISRASAEEFSFPTDLWARTVYDFLLAYHLRTINRGHLLGALTPMYLAWVASHLRNSEGDAAKSAYHIEETAAAFVAEKPYIVSRWRWPDRFNP
jgi:hypothetical protein